MYKENIYFFLNQCKYDITFICMYLQYANDPVKKI